MPDMELFVDGYLNPYAKGTGNISYEGGEFSVEELYAEIVRGLPFDMQIKAGKYLAGFGQLEHCPSACVGFCRKTFIPSDLFWS